MAQAYAAWSSTSPVAPPCLRHSARAVERGHRHGVDGSSCGLLSSSTPNRGVRMADDPGSSSLPAERWWREGWRIRSCPVENSPNIPSITVGHLWR